MYLINLIKENTNLSQYHNGNLNSWEYLNVTIEARNPNSNQDLSREILQAPGKRYGLCARIDQLNFVVLL